MKTTLLCSIIALLGFASSHTPRQDAEGAVHWETDLVQATELASETDRPLLIVFR